MEWTTPSFLINMNADHKEKGWNVRIKSAYALFGEYYLRKQIINGLPVYRRAYRIMKTSMTMFLTR
jgi:hypothetical protein